MSSPPFPFRLSSPESPSNVSSAEPPSSVSLSAPPLKRSLIPADAPLSESLPAPPLSVTLLLKAFGNALNVIVSLPAEPLISKLDTRLDGTRVMRVVPAFTSRLLLTLATLMAGLPLGRSTVSRRDTDPSRIVTA